MASISEQTVPVFIKYLKNFALWLKKGEALATEKGISHDKFVASRLIEDQKDLTFQVQAVSNTLKNWLVRFGVIEPRSIPDDEKTFAELYARLQMTIDMLEKADVAKIDADADKEVVLPGGTAGDFGFKDRQTYVSEYLIPYFQFHLVTGYCILRAKGVDIGGLDFLNGVLVKKE